MALPTLPSYWVNRYKNIQERAMIQRRDHEANFREKWTDNARYFHDLDVHTTKQRAWSSDQSFHDSMDAFRRANDREVKALRLQERRAKLTQLFKKERDQQEAELRGLSPANYERLNSMREKSEGLKSAREEKRKQIADERLYDHWKKNNPDLRKLESEQHKKHVVDKWGNQVTERKWKQEEEAKKKQEYEEQLEQERLVALELEREREETKLKEEMDRADMLKEQVQELKSREKEAQSLKVAQDRLQQQQWELEELDQQRQLMEERRKKAEFGRVLVRQHKAQLRRKAREVQTALELDMKILEALSEKAVEDDQVQTARREKAKADAAWMKQVVEEQLKLEKAREAELDMLYKDEAARVWQKRESEWERERIARERLMSEVLRERQFQIQDRLEENRLQQEESLKQREELVRDLEVVQQLTRREQEEEEARKAERRQEIEAQLSERTQRQEVMRGRLAEEVAAEQAVEQEYDDLLAKEARHMNIRGYQPKTFPRRSAWE